MPTIVKHLTTGHHYVMLGTGYGIWATARPSRASELIIRENKGEAHILHVCDKLGRVLWLRPQEVEIISIDGQAPAEALQGLQTLDPAAPP
jgi:hypothetical protein